MLVIDNSFKIIASSYDAKDIVGVHEDINVGQYLDENIIDFIRNSNIMSKIRNSGRSHYVRKENPYNGTLVNLIYIEDVEVGQLVVLEGGRQFQEVDFKLMESFSILLSVELQKTNFFNIDKDLISNYILTDLIEKNYMSEEIIHKRFRYSIFKSIYSYK
ncbi:hypothetical protein [Clostridium sp. JS66]|uniref:hypothetical protein n=1 Tax=Clostridium sp. JS66 TaxID=3064705 RepID=UPI00298E0ADC|nr:hypothetical protein [Clostridium sp. JS66]WPC43431.1 hypothetical protein Q6H37_08165 [Clostridium sp. JS66]